MADRIRIRARARGLAKIPREVRELHRAADLLIRVAEARVEERYPREIWWNVLIDLREVRQDLEARHPALAPIDGREPAIGEETD